MLMPPKVILFDWHATLVDTFDAMYHAIDDVLGKFDRLGLLTRLTDPEHSKTIEDAKLVKYVHKHRKLHPKIITDKKISEKKIAITRDSSGDQAVVKLKEEKSKLIRVS